jgi:sulfur relay (sulfurtransferase) DsrC/TusE family protein
MLNAKKRLLTTDEQGYLQAIADLRKKITCPHSFVRGLAGQWGQWNKLRIFPRATFQHFSFSPSVSIVVELRFLELTSC